MTTKSFYNFKKKLFLIIGYLCSTGEQTNQTLDNTIAQLLKNPDTMTKNENKPNEYSLIQTLFSTEICEDLKNGKSVKFSFVGFFILFGLFVFLTTVLYQEINQEGLSQGLTKTKVFFFTCFNLILIFCQLRLFFFGNLYFYCIFVAYFAFSLRLFGFCLSSKDDDINATVVVFLFFWRLLVLFLDLLFVFLSSYFFSFCRLPFLSNLKKNVFIFIFSFFFNCLYMFCKSIFLVKIRDVIPEEIRESIPNV